MQDTREPLKSVAPSRLPKGFLPVHLALEDLLFLVGGELSLLFVGDLFG